MSNQVQVTETTETVPVKKARKERSDKGKKRGTYKKKLQTASVN